MHEDIMKEMVYCDVCGEKLVKSCDLTEQEVKMPLDEPNSEPMSYNTETGEPMWRMVCPNERCVLAGGLDTALGSFSY